MNNRRLTNQPKSEGSSSKPCSGKKFVRPRSFRRNLDANSTVVFSGSSHDVSVMGSSRNLNQTVRHNLDTTISAPFYPKIKPSLGPLGLSSTTSTDLEYDASNDADLDLDLIYNEYLQALMKQLIVKRTIRQQEEKLGDQILIQSEHLHKQKATYMNFTNKIENLKLQSEIVEVLNQLKESIDSIDEFSKQYDTCNYLKKLNEILRHECDLVTIRNIKPINSQKDYDELISTLNKLTESLKKFYLSGRNFEGVNKLAISLKCFNELTEKVRSAAKKVALLKKKAATVFIKQSSDYFAEQEGYF